MDADFVGVSNAPFLALPGLQSTALSWGGAHSIAGCVALQMKNKLPLTPLWLYPSETSQSFPIRIVAYAFSVSIRKCYKGNFLASRLWRFKFLFLLRSVPSWTEKDPVAQ